MLNENFIDMLLALDDGRVDYLTMISGVDFHKGWNSRMVVEIDGMSVWILGLRELLINKSSTGREKDEADIPTIKRLLRLH